MSDKDNVILGEEIGSGLRIRYDDRRNARAFGGRSVDGRLLAKARKQNVPRPAGMGDIPNRFVEIQAQALEGEYGGQKDVTFDRPMSVALAKGQAPDLDSFPWNEETRNFNIPAGSNGLILVQFQMLHGVRGKLTHYGWRTIAAAQTVLQFGLYLGNSLVIPGGKYLASSPRTIAQFSPSSNSTDFEDLAAQDLPVEPDTIVSIRVTNPSAVAYPAWGRIMGYHWEEEEREDGRRAYYNTRTGEVD